MKDAQKNRDPARAVARARADARCALRKLDLLDELARINPAADRTDAAALDWAGDASAYLARLARELGL